MLTGTVAPLLISGCLAFLLPFMVLSLRLEDGDDMVLVVAAVVVQGKSSRSGSE